MNGPKLRVFALTLFAGLANLLVAVAYSQPTGSSRGEGAKPSNSGEVQTTGVLGSRGATTTIDGRQLPPPPSKFGGVIKETAKDSKPYWSPSVVPPKGAPNVLLIMTDDQGFGVTYLLAA